MYGTIKRVFANEQWYTNKQWNKLQLAEIGTVNKPDRTKPEAYLAQWFDDEMKEDETIIEFSNYANLETFAVRICFMTEGNGRKLVAHDIKEFWLHAPNKVIVKNHIAEYFKQYQELHAGFECRMTIK